MTKGSITKTYDRLFNIRQHGWLNIQALQVNLSYSGEKDLVATLQPPPQPAAVPHRRYGRIPDGRGKEHGHRRQPAPLLPGEPERDPAHLQPHYPGKDWVGPDYRREQEEIFTELREKDAEILCEEWVNSGGVIIRFSRKCLEIKALDEQDCIRSDMAVCAFIRSLLRCPSLPVETDQDTLLALTEDAIQRGHGSVPAGTAATVYQSMGSCHRRRAALPPVHQRQDRAREPW